MTYITGNGFPGQLPELPEKQAELLGQQWNDHDCILEVGNPFCVECQQAEYREYRLSNASIPDLKAMFVRDEISLLELEDRVWAALERAER